MLNNDALNQLTQLKKDIKASKEYGSGAVIGSNGRFGFVKLDDGRDAYLSPEKMQRVIPGDRVYVSLAKNDKNKLEADLEKLITPSLNRFVGQYRIKGSAHFVQPCDPQSSRWIFIPPKARTKCDDGDYVVAKLINHPFRDTKASAKILEKIGQRNESKFELKFIKAKYQIDQSEPQDACEQAEVIEKQFIHEAFGERADLSHIPFVTIDSATTKDMDDAIAMETPHDGRIRIHVAIADPASFIAQDSPLAELSARRAQTTYLLGGAASMLPIRLSHHCFSIEPNKKRPALVCHLDIDPDGEINEATFEFAIIESKHKLSYENVAAYLELQQETVPEKLRPMLDSLLVFSNLRREFRKKNSIVAQNHSDYDFQLDDNGHITSIKLRPRTLAHQIVEEAMLATNISGAKLLREHNLGLCVLHKGFREERLGEVKALLKEENIKHGELNVLTHYLQLFRDLDKDENTKKLAAPLQRMMDSSSLSLSFGPHIGMGLCNYATMTSPIRRYGDLYNHWSIQQILTGKKIDVLDQARLDPLVDTLQSCRQADRELALWLVAQYTEKIINTEALGQIRIVTQHGFGVRLQNTGIEGFVSFPREKQKKYDAKRMTLEIAEEKYYLGKKVNVKIKSVNIEKRRITFELT